MTAFEFFAVEDGGPILLPVPPDATAFPDLYRGLVLGVYTALRTFDHDRFLHLDRHLDRTERSMALLGWDYRLDRPRLCAALHRVVSASPAAENRVRIDVLAEPALSLGSRSRELIALQPFTPPPDELYETGVAVAFAPDLARERPTAKTADFAARRPVTGGLAPGVVAPYEYLLLSPDGYILEGTGTNFYGVRDGIVYTAREGVLEGITREIILGLIAELGIPLRLEAVHRDDVARLNEAALSGSSRAFLPVVSIAGQMVGDGRPGPISRRILAAYRRFVAANIRTAV